ncbi:MAG: hypothetical protein HQL98_08270 [Magnetococcales bacterium]|nr:hypothetical protein [Magnetococcales bacterium]
MSDKFFVLGNKIKDLLDSENSLSFKDEVTKYVNNAFYGVFEAFLNGEQFESLIEKKIEKVNLDPALLRVAIESAFIDLYRASQIHEFADDAPALNRKGAAVMSWLNRIKPIQSIDGDNDVFLFVNPIFALLIGMAIAWNDRDYNKNNMYTNKDFFNKILAELIDLLKENSYCKLSFYRLMWHAPDHRELTLMLSFFVR